MQLFWYFINLITHFMKQGRKLSSLCVYQCVYLSICVGVLSDVRNNNNQIYANLMTTLHFYLIYTTYIFVSTFTFSRFSFLTNVLDGKLLCVIMQNCILKKSGQNISQFEDRLNVMVRINTKRLKVNTTHFYVYR